MSCPAKRSTHPKRGLAVTNCRLNLKLPYRLRCTQISNQCAPASPGIEHNGVQTGHSLLLFPLPLLCLAPGGVSKEEGPCPRPPSLWGLVSKGGGQGPRPLCRFKGVRGEIEIPPRFSLGGRGGTFSFQKRISPLASRPGNRDCPLWEQRKCGGHSARQSRVILAPHIGAFVLLDQFNNGLK